VKNNGDLLRDALDRFYDEIRKPRRRRGGRAGDALVGWKELHCEALGVHPKQIKEAEADAKRKGVPVDFDKQGRPVFTSRKQYKAYCNAYGVFNRDGGYGDAMPGQYKERPPAPDYEKEARELASVLFAHGGGVGIGQEQRRR
jgi:hypothetical protein